MKAFKLTVVVVCVALSGIAMSCSAPCLWRDVKEDLDANPKLRQRGVVVDVLSANNGYITIDVQKGFSPRTTKAISQGKSLRDIQMFTDSSVDVLIEAEEILKKRPDVKSVSWQADDPDASSTGGPKRDADPCFKDSLQRTLILGVVVIGVLALGLLAFKRFGKQTPSIPLTSTHKIISGISIIIISPVVYWFVPAGSSWWFFLLVPALFLIGSGIAQINSSKRAKTK
ncbi:MAG: hypothetical protein QOG23_4801 [Blastocatellia bacterium]|nr:hypothetical protein [Blastocatellia bacterium]